MAYEVERGKPVDPDDPDDETKIPQFANDLHHPQLTLVHRQTQLQKLADFNKRVREWELRFIMESKSYETLSNLISNLATRCDQQQLTTVCENLKCPSPKDNKIPIYQNYCKVCMGDIVPNQVQMRLAILRNVKTRLDYLANQVSSSLSNLLSFDELMAVLQEIGLWEFVLKVQA